MKAIYAATTALGLLLATILPVQGQNTTFDDVVDTEISNAANWDNGLPTIATPGFIDTDTLAPANTTLSLEDMDFFQDAGRDVTVTGTTAGNIVISGNADRNFDARRGSIFTINNSNVTVTFEDDGGSATTFDRFQWGTNGETATLNLAAGTLNIGAANRINFGRGGQGIFNMSGGTTNIYNQNLTIQASGTNGSQLNVSGGVLNVGDVYNPGTPGSTIRDIVFSNNAVGNISGTATVNVTDDFDINADSTVTISGSAVVNLMEDVLIDGNGTSLAPSLLITGGNTTVSDDIVISNSAGGGGYLKINVGADSGINDLSLDSLLVGTTTSQPTGGGGTVEITGHSQVQARQITFGASSEALGATGAYGTLIISGNADLIMDDNAITLHPSNITNTRSTLTIRDNATLTLKDTNPDGNDRNNINVYGNATATIQDNAVLLFDDLNIGNSNGILNTDRASVSILGSVNLLLGTTDGNATQNSAGIITIGRGFNSSIMRQGSGNLTIGSGSDSPTVTARSLHIEDSLNPSIFTLNSGNVTLTGVDSTGDVDLTQGDFQIQGQASTGDYVNHLVNINGGTLSLTDTFTMDTGTLTMTGGSITANFFDLDGASASNSTIVANISGGSITTLGAGFDIGNDSPAEVTISGNTQITVGFDGGGDEDFRVDDEGTLTITGGTFSIVDDFLIVPDFPTDGNVVANISGATIRTNALVAADGTTPIAGTTSTNGSFTFSDGSIVTISGSSLATGNISSPEEGTGNSQDFILNGSNSMLTITGNTSIYTERNFDINDGEVIISGSNITADNQVLIDSSGNVTITNSTILAKRNFDNNNDDSIIFNTGNIIFNTGAFVYTDKQRTGDLNGLVRFDGSNATLNTGAIVQAQTDIQIGRENSSAPLVEFATMTLNGGILRPNSNNGNAENHEVFVRAGGTLTGTGTIENGQLELDDGNASGGSTLFAAGDGIFDTITIQNRTDTSDTPIGNNNESIKIEGAGQETAGSLGATVNIDLGAPGTNDKVVLVDGRADWRVNSTLNLNNAGGLSGGQYTIIDDQNEGSGDAIFTFDNTADYGTVPDDFAFRLQADNTQDIVLDVRELVTASFNDTTLQTNVTLDFGVVSGANATLPFTIYNSGDNSWDLALTSIGAITGANATDFSTDAMTFTNLAAGDSQTFNALFTSNGDGNYSAQMIFTLNGTQDLMGLADPNAADFFFNGTHNADQFLTLNFVAFVPEPASFAPLGILLGAAGFYFRKRRRRNKPSSAADDIDS